MHWFDKIRENEERSEDGKELGDAVDSEEKSSKPGSKSFKSFHRFLHCFCVYLHIFTSKRKVFKPGGYQNHGEAPEETPDDVLK